MLYPCGYLLPQNRKVRLPEIASRALHIKGRLSKFQTRFYPASTSNKACPHDIRSGEGVIRGSQYIELLKTPRSTIPCPAVGYSLAGALEM